MLTNERQCDILQSSRERNVHTMKTAKNVNAIYSMETGNWAIRDNGEVIANGQGIATYAKAVAELKKVTTKKVVSKYVER